MTLPLCAWARAILWEIAFRVDNDKAKLWLSKAVEAGNGNAMSMLGCMYRDGIAIQQDLKKAEELLKQSHNHNCLPGTVNLAHAYMNGIFGRQDYRRAKALLEHTVEKKHPEGTFFLGLLHHRGDEKNRDINKALALYRAAEQLGYAPAKAQAAYLIIAEKPNEKETAKQWLIELSKQGNPEGWYGLARYNLMQPDNPAAGIPMRQLALGQLQQAAQMGHGAAMISLAQLLLQDNNEQQDFEAGGLLQQAANAGYAQAIYLLGLMFKEGRGTPANAETALQLMNEARLRGLQQQDQLALGSLPPFP